MDITQLKKFNTITLQELKIFQLFIKTGSIQKTAEYLKVSQPTCTRSISALEEKLETRLFLRVKNEYQLTEKAIKLYDPLVLLMRSYSNTIKNNQDWSKKLRLFMPIASSYISAKYYIPELKKQTEKLDIELITSSMSFFLNHPKFSQYIINSMDITFIRSEYDKYLNPNIWEKIYTKTLSQKLYSSERYIDKNSKISSPHDLSNHTCILSSNQAVNKWVFKHKNKEELTVPIKKFTIIDNEAIAAHAVDAGNGIAILSESLVKGDSRKDTIEILTDYQPKNASSELYINKNCKHKNLDKLIQIISHSLNLDF